MGAGAIAPAPTDMFYTQTTIKFTRFWPSLGSEFVTENCGGPQIHYETSAKRRLRTADSFLGNRKCQKWTERWGVLPIPPPLVPTDPQGRLDEPMERWGDPPRGSCSDFVPSVKATVWSLEVGHLHTPASSDILVQDTDLMNPGLGGGLVQLVECDKMPLKKGHVVVQP